MTQIKSVIITADNHDDNENSREIVRLWVEPIGPKLAVNKAVYTAI